MPTKAELEARVEELEVELEANQSKGLVIDVAQTHAFFAGVAIRATFNDGKTKGEVEVKLLHSESV